MKIDPLYYILIERLKYYPKTGEFVTLKAAHKAYMKKRKELFGEFYGRLK